MKLKDLVKEVEQDLVDEELKLAKHFLADKLSEIKSAEKTLKKLKKEYAELLEKDVEDLELDGYEY